MRFLAKTLSYLFHPLLFTTYLVLLVGLFFPSLIMVRHENLRLVVIFIFCFTFVLPALNMIMFRYFGNISSLQMETQQERILPFIFISLTYALVTFLFFYKLPFSDGFNKLMVVVTLLVVSGTLATFFAKVSIHSLAMTGLLGVLLVLNRVDDSGELLIPTVAVTLFSGAVMSARLYLNAHTLREIVWGGLLGFFVSVMAMILLY